ncbi:CLUMA_CG012280, isoform A [Clunio marinus]|uniref:CLUMA_CG012280, isoform A n=1 Tax=Clunio marinus TaxID=568069 RepID=A0A1J1IGU4_9DIPT|nr:CLUMA_CG012280, isoform A [Clunio marinus]
MFKKFLCKLDRIVAMKSQLVAVSFLIYIHFNAIKILNLEHLEVYLMIIVRIDQRDRLVVGSSPFTLRFRFPVNSFRPQGLPFNTYDEMKGH